MCREILYNEASSNDQYHGNNGLNDGSDDLEDTIAALFPIKALNDLEQFNKTFLNDRGFVHKVVRNIKMKLKLEKKCTRDMRVQQSLIQKINMHNISCGTPLVKNRVCFWSVQILSRKILFKMI